MCVKMQLIQFNAHLLGEKDGSEFEEATSETDEETEIKSEDQADKADGKIERSRQSEELASANSESGNNSPGADKLEPIIEEEKENMEEAVPTPKEATWDESVFLAKKNPPSLPSSFLVWERCQVSPKKISKSGHWRILRKRTFCT